MPKKNRVKLKINKIQLLHEPEDIPADFGHLNPILYLELLENKEKVIKNLRDQEFIAPVMPEIRKEEERPESRMSTRSDTSNKENESTFDNQTDRSESRMSERSEISMSDDGRKKEEKKSKSKRKSVKKEETVNNKVEKLINKNSPEIVFIDSDGKPKETLAKKLTNFFTPSKTSKKDLKNKLSEKRDSEVSINVKKSKYDIGLNDAINRVNPKVSELNKNREILSKLKRKDESLDRDRDRDKKHKKNKDRDDDYESDRDRRRRKEREEYDRDRERRHRRERGIKKLRDSKTVKKSLTALLSSHSKHSSNKDIDDNREKRKERHIEREEEEREKEKELNEPTKDGKYVPPKLSEIPTNPNVKIGDKTYHDITNSKPKESELNRRRELQYKFDILRRKYKGAVIPEFTEFSDLNNMEKTYETTVRKLNLDSSVENYKKYLIGGFMVMEFLLGSLLKFDMTGFSQAQMMNVNAYENLLIEIGEKSYLKGGSQFPVELRLIFMIVINAGLFIIGKKITKSMGGDKNNNLMSMMSNLSGNTNNNTNNSNPTSNTAPNFVGKKMKGPSNMFVNIEPGNENKDETNKKKVD
jgi:hypothetical protein